ncbi:MAG: GAF domain-containing protein [Candidatus Cloacimonadota bacterium]|nr:GAF domain-containing protein [Candidatus Cloacimonadota bacterium]
MKKEIKQKRYERLYKQLQELLLPVSEPTSRMSTIAALLHHKFKYYFWTGFYRLIQDELLVGCYQGPLACLKLKKNTGVCWKAIKEQKSIIVPNVHQFPGHIACDSRSNSEIVVPIKNFQNKLVAVLDVDSKDFDAFDKIDQLNLENIVKLIYKNVSK